MKHNYPWLLAILALTIASPRSTIGQPVVQQTLDALLDGDDPSQRFTFDLPYDPLTPIVVRLDGLFRNLSVDGTASRITIHWIAPSSGSAGTDWNPLPGSGQLPLHFEHTLAFTPDSLFLLVEGGGPADYFRFTGDFSIQQVPEPGAMALFGAGIGLAAVRFFCRNRKAALS
jgi:hypothetical protein